MIAATPDANVEIKGALANIGCWCGFEFEVPIKNLQRS